jgi:hypothetical protein
MINYFVSYHYASRFGNGFGHCCLQRKKPIGPNDIESIEETLKTKNKFDEITIINWQRFENVN